MKLTYFGASYTSSVRTIDTVEIETERCFMGCPFKMQGPKSLSMQSTSCYLTYHGARHSPSAYLLIVGNAAGQ